MNCKDKDQKAWVEGRGSLDKDGRVLFSLVVDLINHFKDKSLLVDATFFEGKIGHLKSREGTFS